MDEALRGDIPESATRTTVWPAGHPWGPGRRRLLGLGFILLLALLLSLAVGAYAKVFTPAVTVTVLADHTGLQLDPHADVKVRGVLVGEVRSVSSDGTHARIHVALDPGQVRQIPSNVTATMPPKTIFGEKYVDLMPPAAPSERPVADGQVIPQDRSAASVEIERVLNNVLPLLQAVPPDKLSATLSAVSTALQGRGERIGGTVVTLDSYLAALNKQMPVIASDVRKLADVLQVYQSVLPDLLTILRNVTVTSNTIVNQAQNLRAMLYDVTGLADTAAPFLVMHGGRLIQFGQVARPVLDVLAQYAPEYPCLTQGTVRLQKNVEGAFDSGRLHIKLEIVRDNGKYLPGHDEPANTAQNDPYCYGLPEWPIVPAPNFPFNSGYDYNAPHGGLLQALPEFPIRKSGPLPPNTHLLYPWLAPYEPENSGGSGGGKGGQAATGDMVDAPMGYAGTAEEQSLIKPLVAASTGRNVTALGDITDLLWGPLMRGAVVNAD